MIFIPAAILSSVFAFLSGLHFYWAAGGKWGWEDAIPKRDGVPVFAPGRMAILVVALALLGAAVISLWRADIFASGPEWVHRAGVWATAMVFAMRAVGDFRYCGFFKRIKDTDVARKDSLIYSPLSLVLPGMAVWLLLGS